MFNEPVVFLDIETTGISSDKNRIIEIGAIRVEDGEVVDEFKSFINPATPLPQFITKITGITAEDVVSAPYFDEIAEQLYTFLSGAIFIAHNVRFDYSFIKRQLQACGYEWHPKLLCTVRLSRALYPESRGHSLEKIIARHNIVVKSRHRAYDDAKAIKDFTEIACQEHGQEKFTEAVQKQFKKAYMPPNLESNLDSVDNTPGVYIYEDELGNPLYVGKSIKVKSRLQSHFREDINNVKEMKMSQLVHNIKIKQTSSELEALLLESSLVKQLMPIYNRQLRRKSEMVIARKDYNENGYALITLERVKRIDDRNLDNIYGVYSTMGKAKLSLLTICKTFELCPKLIGIEKAKTNCFSYQLKKCSGACIKREAVEKYNARLEIAMERTKLESWPYKGSIKLKVSDQTTLVINNWQVIGRISKSGNKIKSELYDSSFDLDSYKILKSFIPKYQIENLDI